MNAINRSRTIATAAVLAASALIGGTAAAVVAAPAPYVGGGATVAVAPGPGYDTARLTDLFNLTAPRPQQDIQLTAVVRQWEEAAPGPHIGG
jgi:hypothetical protein